MISRSDFLWGLAGLGLGALFDLSQSEAQGAAPWNEADWCGQQWTGLNPPWTDPVGRPLYFDPNYGNLIVQTDMDGGDTAQREGFCWFGAYLLSLRNVRLRFGLGISWSQAVSFLEVERGVFRRHPNASHADWVNPKNFSRDQLFPTIAALGALGPRESLDGVWARFVSSRGICPNGDAGGPNLRNLFLRARRDSERIEALGEGLLLAQSYLCGASGMDDVGKDLNFLVELLAAKLWRTTPSSEEAAASYFKHRPVNYGCYLESYRKEYSDVLQDRDRMVQRIEKGIAAGWIEDCHPVVGALRWYFRPETNAGWGPAAIYEEVLGLYFSEHLP